MLEALNLARSAETPEEFWAAQRFLLEAIKHEEKFITKRRRQVKALNKAKWTYTRSADKSINRIHRYDAIIEAKGDSEFHHQGDGRHFPIKATSAEPTRNRLALLPWNFGVFAPQTSIRSQNLDPVLYRDGQPLV
jgi:hypothetical protein